MTFQGLLNILDENGQGVLAYQECARAANKGIKQNPQHAAAFFLLGAAAQRFVETYQGEPLSINTAGVEFARFEKFVKDLTSVYEVGDSASQLEVLNSVATKLFA